jgi:hypothetical protein
MINAKISLMIAVAIAVLASIYFAVGTSTSPLPASAIAPVPAPAAAPSPQYFHDHPSELDAGKSKCNQGTAPPDPFCTNVRKGEELVEADAYSRAVSGGKAPK